MTRLRAVLAPTIMQAVSRPCWLWRAHLRKIQLRAHYGLWHLPTKSPPFFRSRHMGEPGLCKTQPPTCRKYHPDAQSGNYWVLFRQTRKSKLRVPAFHFYYPSTGEFYCLCQQCRERAVGSTPHQKLSTNTRRFPSEGWRTMGMAPWSWMVRSLGLLEGRISRRHGDRYGAVSRPPPTTQLMMLPRTFIMSISHGSS